MTPRVSIIVPCYNEEDNIEALFSRLNKSFSEDIDLQVVFVDDGSTDDTLGEIRKLASMHDSVKYISLSRNFGHQYALKAGLDKVDADCVIMMDADLQHPPELIEKLLSKWRDGYDVVYTIRLNDRRLSWTKRITSAMFYWMINRLSDITISKGAADFRLIDRKVLKVFKEDINEYYLFIRGLTAWVGFRQYAVNYQPGDRHAGRTKYSFLKMLGFAINGITSFSIRPIRLSIILGFLISFLAGLYAVYALGAWLLLDRIVPGWASVIISILFIGGVQLLVLGIIGEYVGKMFYEVKHRPNYIIKETNL